LLYSENYEEVAAEQEDSGIVSSMECYIEHFVVGFAEQVDSVIVGTMESAIGNIMWQILHRR